MTHTTNIKENGGHLKMEHLEMRDYFAAKAMQQYIGEVYGIPNLELAKRSYDMADAMLRARENT